MKAAELERGTVKFFDSRDNKRFGFLRLESGEEIFFHLNDGQKVALGVGEPCLEHGKMARVPQVGDAILFKRGDGRQGPKACPWIFSDEFERVASESAKNTGEPKLSTTEDGMEYQCYESGKPAVYTVGKSYVTAMGTPCPNFRAPQYSHGGITNRADLERLLKYPIPDEMKQALSQRFDTYEKAVAERRPRLEELLRTLLGEAPVRFEDYENALAELFETDYTVYEAESGLTSDEIKEEDKRCHRSRILKQYWKPRTPKSVLHFYPGGCSDAGFLGWNEKLEDVIQRDKETLEHLGYTYEAVVEKLRRVSALKHQFKVEAQCWLGWQVCPFDGCEYDRHSIKPGAPAPKAPGSTCDLTITNLKTGDVIKMPGMIDHLIEAHHFFEGAGSHYRVDPEQLVKVIFG